jgi:hypothetical protein
LQNGSECFELHNECLSISGNDYHPGGHIIDPETGEKKLADKPFAIKTCNAVEGEVFSTVGFITFSKKNSHTTPHLHISTTFDPDTHTIHQTNNFI